MCWEEEPQGVAAHFYVGAEKPAPSSQHTLRGLEKIMKEQSGRTKLTRFNASDAVLDEQDVQRDFDSLAFAYNWKTIESKREAAVRAVQDAADIASYLEETRRACRRMSM